ncbi:recombination protein NinB [Klebsiella pneumoniae]|uniref:recombination protein NinB n=1 Tax=Klebsiella pneumoniae TaxID=573 RepID=UPI002B05467F|nr:recombination protein NinB [Klebsiella pneumoniae]
MAIQRSNCNGLASRATSLHGKSCMSQAMPLPPVSLGEVVPGLEGEFCAIRESTAKMGIRRMTSLIEYSRAFAVQNGVQPVKFATR